ncbi:MAG: LptF/LptG family permease [Neisseriaceae bacterium]
MNKLSRYLFSYLLYTTFYVLFALLTVYAVFDSLVQTNPKTGGGILVTLQYLLVRMPVYLYQIAPIAVVVGTVISLGRLVRSNEYVVVRMHFSLFRIARILLYFAFLTGFLTGILGEYLVPISEKVTQQLHVLDKTEKVAKLGRHNLWLKLEDELIELWEVLPDYTLKNVLRYKVIDNQRLGYIKFAKKGEYQGGNTWKLEGVSTLRFGKDQISSTYEATEIWQPNLKLNILSILINKPANMSIRMIWQYISYLKNNHQKTIDYEAELVKKIIYPFSMIIMVLLGLVLTPIIHRYSKEGLRMVLSILLGLVYLVTMKFMVFFTQVSLSNPLWIPVFPGLIFFLSLMWILYKQNKGCRRP